LINLAPPIGSKNTEIAKGYFENVITAYPKSPEAAEAREKLAKCLEYLAEHEFSIAEFYFKQEKYSCRARPFRRNRAQVQRHADGGKKSILSWQSYRNEKNAIRATLAYEALIQHYPKTQFATTLKFNWLWWRKKNMTLWPSCSCAIVGPLPRRHPRSRKIRRWRS
jgi:outer membrane protein assembly factor BamD (BamD/ComL family)